MIRYGGTKTVFTESDHKNTYIDFPAIYGFSDQGLKFNKNFHIANLFQ